MLFEEKMALYDQMTLEAQNGVARLRDENRKFNDAFSVVIGFQNKGISFEKMKDFPAAVSAYEQCVAYGEASTLFRINDYMYSIERLAVLYRKQKRFSDEIRVVSLGLSHRHDANVYDSPFARLEKRLAKAIMLNEKK